MTPCSAFTKPCTRFPPYILPTSENDDHRLSPTLIAAVLFALREAKSQATRGSVLITTSQGKFFSNRFDLGWARSAATPSKAFLRAPPNGGIVPADCRRADLPSDAHRRRHPGPRRRRRIHPGAEPRSSSPPSAFLLLFYLDQRRPDSQPATMIYGEIFDGSGD
ncbi:unnamed protein product [Linum trigynum]